MNKTFTSICKFLFVACPALIAFNTLQAHPTRQINPVAPMVALTTTAVTDSNVVADAALPSADALPATTASVDIQWITPIDSNSDHFEIERSFDAQNFQMAGMIFTSDDRTANHYSFSDKSPVLGHHAAAYYRVKLVDVNGNSIYSAVQAVSLKAAAPSKNSTITPLKNPDHADWKANSASDNQPVITGLDARCHHAA